MFDSLERHAILTKLLCSEKTARHPAWGENAPFREVMGEREPDAWEPHQFPSVPYAQGGQRLGGTVSSKQDGVQSVSGPAVFSPSSSLLSASQRVGASHLTAPLASSNSRMVNTEPRTQQRRQPAAGPSNANNWANKPMSTGSANARGKAATQLRGNPIGLSQRRSSTGTSKDDPIDIDDHDYDPIRFPPRPTAGKPVSTKPSSSRRVAPAPKQNGPSRPGVGSVADYICPPPSQRVPQPLPPLTPRPPPSLEYLTPSSSEPLLTFSTSDSLSNGASSFSVSTAGTATVTSPATSAAAAPQLAGGKRRLGMGRTAVRYANKKFKPLIPGDS
ncbi:hypothetical protein BC628DRAFT_15987 [Trametes gibbosa]|nr:hypothetical protein BC628DRAFT_15987 [Trametes gibbosa]